MKKLVFLTFIVGILLIGAVDACVSLGPSVKTNSIGQWTENLTSYERTGVCLRYENKTTECTPASNDPHLLEVCQEGQIYQECTKWEEKLVVRSQTFSCKDIYFDNYGLNATLVLMRMNNAREACSFSEEETQTLVDFVTHGYNVMEQTDEEYDAFVENATAENAGRPGNCLKWVDIKRDGKWTGYIKTGNEYANGFCMMLLQRGCGGAGLYSLLGAPLFNPASYSTAYYLKMAAFILIPIALIVLAIIWLIRRKKKDE
jgi:hypothetical protein